MPELLDLLAPPRCAICREPGPLLCLGCLASLPLLDGPTCARCGARATRPVDDCAGCRGRRLGFESAAAAVHYEGPGRALVHALKDGGLRALAAPAAALIALVVEPPAADVVTWVPADPLRQALRGYHPPRLVAEGLSGHWGLPAQPLLHGPLWRRPQRGLTRQRRRANVRSAFSGVAGAEGRVVVLVDDVHTTGATLSAAARALRRVGAERVRAVTLARADDA